LGYDVTGTDEVIKGASPLDGYIVSLLQQRFLRVVENDCPVQMVGLHAPRGLEKRNFHMRVPHPHAKIGFLRAGA
jgi:hypothetical protein